MLLPLPQTLMAFTRTASRLVIMEVNLDRETKIKLFMIRIRTLRRLRWMIFTIRDNRITAVTFTIKTNKCTKTGWKMTNISPTIIKRWMMESAEEYLGEQVFKTKTKRATRWLDRITILQTLMGRIFTLASESNLWYAKQLIHRHSIHNL